MWVVCAQTMNGGTYEAGPKRRRLQEPHDLLKDVTAGTLTQKAMERNLHQHVNSIDADMVRPLVLSCMETIICIDMVDGLSAYGCIATIPLAWGSQYTVGCMRTSACR